MLGMVPKISHLSSPYSQRLITAQVVTKPQFLSQRVRRSTSELSQSGRTSLTSYTTDKMPSLSSRLTCRDTFSTASTKCFASHTDLIPRSFKPLCPRARLLILSILRKSWLKVLLQKKKEQRTSKSSKIKSSSSQKKRRSQALTA